MRQESRAGDPAATANLDALTPVSEPAASDAPQTPGRYLIDLLAVVVGICESLADGLADNPQHGELARVGALAASRAAERVAELRAGRAQPAVDDDPTVSERGYKVLVVEDDPDLLTLLTSAFARAGFSTFGAKNGRLGVKMLAELQPDLMVTDIVMPELEGIGAIMEARRLSPATRVIAMSGGGKYGRSNNFLEWAAELGADEVLAKPFRVSSLITAARLVLDRAHAAGAATLPPPPAPPRLLAAR